VETTVGNSALNTDLLMNGSVDAAFIYPGYVGGPGSIPDGVVVRVLSREPVLLAVSSNNPLARLEVIPVKALRGEPLIMFPTSPGPAATVNFVRTLTRHMGAEPNIVAYEPPDEALEAVAHEPPETGPWGSSVSPSTTSTFSTGTPVLSAVSRARTV
jgi:DNA-binding transcriptional LysR family regulator